MNTKAIMGSTLAGIFALGAVGAVAGPAQAPDYKFEKCYGVVKAGKNDCQTNVHACAGQATKDAQGDSWIYLPQGSCEKIVGGSLDKKA